MGALSGAFVLSDASGRLAGQSRDDSGPAFREPWEAQAFAITLALHQRGLFSWLEWSEVLSTQIRTAQSAGDTDLGDTYYRHWLAALEVLVAGNGASSEGSEATRTRKVNYN